MATQVSLTDGAVASAGALAIQTNGTTQAVSISTGQVATLAQNPILTSGTANGVAYLNGSKAVTSGSALTFDGTNFATTGTASATKIIPTGGSATGNGMYLPASNTLAWSNNGSETMRLDSTGNLGLGVTPSAWGSYSGAMDFKGGGALGAFNSSTALFCNSYYNGTSFIYKASTSAGFYQIAGNQHQWYNAASGTAGNAITFTQAMTLDASGNLLVGTTTARNRLTVVSGAGSNPPALGTNGGVTYVGGDGVLYGLLTGVSTSGYSWMQAQRVDGTATAYDIVMQSAGGNLLVGTTSGVVGSERLSISSGSQRGAVLKNSSSGSELIGCWNSATTGDNGFAIFWTEASPTQRGSISYNRAGGLTVYATTSDYRSKTVNGSVQNALSKVALLKPSTGRMNGASIDIDFFVAHELQEVVPSAVTGEKDAVNEDNTPKYQMVDKSALIPLLTAAIQEQQALITQLTDRITALESA